MWFNLQCLFGGADCVGVIAFLGWLDFSTVLLGNFAFSGLMRHSEGANFVMIVMVGSLSSDVMNFMIVIVASSLQALTIT